MLPRGMIIAGLLLSLALPAGAQKDKDTPKVYKTPQEVFDAFIAAINKNDHKARVDCFPPAVQKTLATNWAIHGVYRRSLADKNGKIKGTDFKPVFEAMDRHGLTEKATKGITGLETGKKRDTAKATLIALIKDHAAFVVDYEKALDAAFSAGKKGKRPEIKVKLTDVKIDGDRATATAIATIDAKEEKDAVEFVKVGEGWRLIPGKDRLEEEPKPRKDKPGKGDNP